MGGKLIERCRNTRQSLAHIFRFAANADAKVRRRFEESSGDNAGLVFFAQKLAESFGGAAGQLREGNGSYVGPDGQEILARIEKFL